MKILTNLLKRYWPHFIFAAIGLFSARKILFGKNLILYGEFFGSTDYIFFFSQLLKSWSIYTGLGYSNLGLTTSYGQNPLFWVIPSGYWLTYLALLSLLQLIFSIFSIKIYLLVSILLPFFGMYGFARFYFSQFTDKKSVLAQLAFFSSIIYAVSGQMSARIAAGHLRYSIGHGLFPLLLLCILKGFSEKSKSLKLYYLISSGLIISILVWSMPQLLILTFFLLLFHFLIFLLADFTGIKKFLTFNFLAFALGILLNINIYLPSLLYQETPAYIETPYYTLSYVYLTSRATSFKELLANVAEGTFLGESGFKKIVNLKLFLPALAMLGLLSMFFKKRGFAVFLFLTGATGLIFAWGNNQPLTEFYNFLFAKVIFFKAFRDVGKFAVLYIFSLSLTIPYLIFLLGRLLGKKTIIVLGSILVLFIFYVNPNFTSGNFGNNIEAFSLPEKYEKLHRFLKNRAGDFRIAVFPNDKYVGESDWLPKKSLPSAYYNIFHVLFPLPKNLANSNRSMADWTSRYLDFLELNLGEPWAVEKLGQAAVRYLIVDHSVPGYKKLLSALQNNSRLQKSEAIDGITIFEIRDYEKSSLSRRQPAYYFGDIMGIKYIPSKISLINLDTNPTDLLTNNYSNYLLLYNSSLDDLFYTSLDRFKLSFFPEVRFSQDNAKEFYVPAEYLRNLTQTGINFYNPEIIRTEGKGNKIAKTFSLNKDNYKILVSTISAQGQSNALKITVDGKSMSKKNFRSKSSGAEWLDFGEIRLDESKKIKITVENQDAVSLYLDHFLLVPVSEYEKLKRQFFSIVKTKEIIKIDQPLAESTLAENDKSLTVLSTTYSAFWDICGKEAIRVNFYATASQCNPKDIIQPRFKPDKIYKLSLILWFLFYATALSVLFKLKTRRTS